MVDVSAATRDSTAFALRLLTERHVAVSPGSAFGRGAEGMVRVSLASERSGLLEALDRIADLVEGWSEVPGATSEVAAASIPIMG